MRGPETRTWLWAGACWLGLTLALFAGPLAGHQAFYGRDITSAFLPIEKSVHEAWSHGQLPIWFEDASGGKPLLPNLNAAVFYPPRMLGAFLPFPLFIRLYPIAHLIAAGLGTLVLAREIGLTPPAGFLSAS